MLKTIFYGTPDFAVPCLEKLAQLTDVVLVITTPDRKRGRGKKMLPSPVKKAALELGLEVSQPSSLRDLDFIERILSLKVDLGVVVAFGRILGRRLLYAPRLRCVNVHASLLPLLRGAAPISRAIMDGHKVTGVSMMRMNLGLDAGAVYFTRETPVNADDTAGILHDRLSQIGAGALVEFIEMAENYTLGEPEKQDKSKATYAEKILTPDEWINWHHCALAIEKQIRGLAPKPSASTHFRGKRFKILQAEPVMDKVELVQADGIELSPDFVTPDGTGEIVIDGRFIEVICGRGLLRLKTVQMEGKKPGLASDFVNGYRVKNGEYLGGSEK